jgi:hypothetical protein
MDVGLNAIKRFSYTDILGWSVSRYDKFLMCKRAYYYDYYSRFDTEFPKSKIQSLKQMTSLALEAGNIVHDVIKTLLERLLRTEQPINIEKFIEFARKKTEEACSLKIFTEAYYKEVPSMPYKQVFAGVEKSLKNFISSERYQWILKKAISNKSGWVIEPPGFGETRINGLKAYCKVDFLFPVDGTTIILDWKTGKQDERKHRKQLIGYSTWASYHFGVPSDKIDSIVVYLSPEYKELRFAVSEADMQEFISQVDKETKEMYAYCTTIEQNIPKPKEQFEMTSRTYLCGYCNYRELCNKGVNYDVSGKQADCPPSF